MTMEERTLAIGKALQTGWHGFKAHWQWLIGVTLGYGMLAVVPNYFLPEGVQTPSINTLFIIILIAGAIFVLQAGTIAIALVISQNQTPTIQMLWVGWRRLGVYLIINMVQGFLLGVGRMVGEFGMARGIQGLIIAGFVLLVAGIIIFIRLQFAGFVAIDEGYGPIMALRKSWHITNKHWWKLVLFLLVLGGLILAGGAALIVGLLIAVPVVIVAYTAAYHELKRAV